MPSKKKKYNARFPVGRIKKIMQSDEEVGKVAQAVPIIISRTLELFVESLLTKTLKITNSRNAKTLSTSHMKQCIMSEQRFDFLRELVRNIPDISVAEEAANYIEEDNHSSPDDPYGDSDTPFDLSMPSTSAVRSSLTRHHQQGMATNGQNGGHGHEYPRNYLKRSVSSNANSVIMHTTSLANATGVGYSSTECLPPKLSRSESTPVPPPPPTHPQQQTSTLPPASSHPRLKHQSFSMPSSCISSNNNKPNNFPQQLRPPSQQTAIPAPIVSIDYCNKPVVKIDYSNLPQITSNAATSAPMSAPASMSSNASAFNFTAEPVINIDLSNIVTTVGGTNTKSSTPPVATISIGTTPQQSRNSKTAMAEPFDSSSANVKPAATMTTSTVVNSGNSSCLELDEDYDNI